MAWIATAFQSRTKSAANRSRRSRPWQDVVGIAVNLLVCVSASPQDYRHARASSRSEIASESRGAAGPGGGGWWGAGPDPQRITRSRRPGCIFERQKNPGRREYALPRRGRGLTITENRMALG